MFSYLRPLTALQFSNNFTAHCISGTILSIWTILVNERCDWYIPLFINDLAETQSFKDVKQLPKATNGSGRNGILTPVSESIVQVLGLQHDLLGIRLLSVSAYKTWRILPLAPISWSFCENQVVLGFSGF